MRRITSLILCLTFVPTLASAGDGLVLSLTGSGIDPVETSEVSLIVAATVDAGSDVQYCWSAIPGTSASPVASYRYGWDLLDPNDPDDPGWSVPSTAFDGSEICAPVQVFLTGFHAFVVEVRDEVDVATRVVVQIQVNEVVPALARSWGAVKSLY